jgi:hypothetical protein
MTAARYQIVIMYLISGATCASTIAASYISVLAVTDSDHRVRSERIIKRQKGEETAFIANVFASARRFWDWRRSTRESGTPLVSSHSEYGAVNGRI